MTKETTTSNVDRILHQIVDRSYKELVNFKQFCEKFVNKWNSLPNAQQITIDDCNNDFFKQIYQSGLCPTSDGIETNFETPEEAAELVMNYVLQTATGN